VRPELVLRAWASSRLDFFRAKVIRVNRQLGSATIVWAGENDEDEDDIWESDEEELPLAYLRSISGHEDLVNAEGTSQHSPSHGGSKFEQRLSKAVEIRRAVGDAQAMHSASGDYHHHSPTSKHTSNPLHDDAPFPNELSSLLDEFGVCISQYQHLFCTQLLLRVKPVAFLPVQTNHYLPHHLYITILTQLGSCYEKMVAYARGTSLEKHLRPLGEKELIEAGIPIMKARKVILAEIEITVTCTEPILR